MIRVQGILVVFEAVVLKPNITFGQPLHGNDLLHSYFLDYTAEEEMVETREAAEVRLHELMSNAEKKGFTVKHAAAHHFSIGKGDGNEPVGSINSLYLVFEAAEPHDGTEVMILKNPFPLWRHAQRASVAGTDREGEGWFLNYHVVRLNTPWPENTIHDPWRHFSHRPLAT